MTDTEIKLPSKFSVRNQVELNFGPHRIKHCEVAGVRFTDFGRTYYDVLVPLEGGDQTIVKDVEEVCLKKPKEL